MSTRWSVVHVSVYAVLNSSLCPPYPQPAAKAPPRLPLSGAKARTPPPGTWCRCPPPRPPTCSVQQHLRTLLCSPAHVLQVLTTRSLPDLSYFGFVSASFNGNAQNFSVLTFSVVKKCFFWTVLPNEVDMSSPLMYGTPSSRVEGTPRSGVRGTPARQRPDLGSVMKGRQVDLHSEPVSKGVKNI